MPLLVESPEKKHFGIFFFACHGMAWQSMQQILVNEFDDKRGFYKLFGIESTVRTLSEHCKNCYFVCIFACCRELYSPQDHSNCVGALSIEDADI